ncbi:hypothetical protein RSC3_00010 [Bacillus paralicheniformis]|nr:hypothetical protein RSC3_00010 [Bacillus paralicheniformis]
MTDHYYSEKPSAKSSRSTWAFRLRNRTFTFISDSGVFSKREVDFGSRLLIEAFREPDTEGDFLDVGCGYGPIGLSLAADFEDRMVHMIDVNERAVELSKENALNNQIDNTKIYQSDLFANVEPAKNSLLLLLIPHTRREKNCARHL